MGILWSSNPRYVRYLYCIASFCCTFRSASLPFPFTPHPTHHVCLTIQLLNLESRFHSEHVHIPFFVFLPLCLQIDVCAGVGSLEVFLRLSASGVGTHSFLSERYFPWCIITPISHSLKVQACVGSLHAAIGVNWQYEHVVIILGLARILFFYQDKGRMHGGMRSPRSTDECI